MPDAPKKQYDLVRLTTGKILVNATPDGAMQAIKADVELSMDAKDIIVINQNPVITASGYDKINKVAGVSIVMPNRIDVPGHGIQANPFFVIDPDTGAIRFVMAKMSAIGFSPVGNLAVVDQTLLFDLLSYLKQDVLSKIKKIPGFGKVTNKNSLSADEIKNGYFIPILSKDYGLWVDTRHGEFMKVISEHTQRQRFAERIALGILKRNCLRHHPAIGIMNVQLEQGSCHIPILAWRKDLSLERMRSIAENTGARDGVETVRSEVIKTDQIDITDAKVCIAEAVSDISEKPTSDGVINDINDDDGITGKEVKDIKEPFVSPSKRGEFQIKIGEMIEGLGPERWQEFYNRMVPSGRDVEQFDEEETLAFHKCLQAHCKKLGV